MPGIYFTGASKFKHAIHFACYTCASTKLIEFSLIVQTSYNKAENDLEKQDESHV